MFGFKVTCWALLFIFKLRFSPGVSIATVYKINDYLCSKFMYRFFYYQNNFPDFYCDYFKQNSELHNYSTHNFTKLHMNFQRTNYRKYTVFNKRGLYMEWSQ